jgi:hypothetical protein
MQLPLITCLGVRLRHLNMRLILKKIRLKKKKMYQFDQRDLKKLLKVQKLLKRIFDKSLK